MTITLEIRPEAEAALRQRARMSGRGFEAFAASLLEDAAHLRSPAAGIEPGFGQKLLDALGTMRGELTDDEVDTIFSREPTTDRPVHFE